MAINSIRCPVLGSEVTQITDFEGCVTRVICAEYRQADGTCQLKKASLEGGPLARLLERLSENSLTTRSPLCIMRAT